MTDREQSKRRTDDEVEEVDETLEVAESEVADIDELLDEIDSVLEENAEEFVKNYVQKGGQ
ncbi:MAG TPA: ubiquitin-like protein Pup [Acidimicrobiia bacterium]|nr:ubiquitin-like protein Pup [Acidimicrobiia bacterium]